VSPISIFVEAGYYQESSWEIPPEKTVSINGASKSEVFITAGMQYYDNFINYESGINIFFQHFLYLLYFY
jgi:hypothetical protein